MVFFSFLSDDIRDFEDLMVFFSLQSDDIRDFEDPMVFFSLLSDDIQYFEDLMVISLSYPASGMVCCSPIVSLIMPAAQS
jgi:hypothetical protein